MRKYDFPFPMAKAERVVGLAYIPVHSYFLSWLVLIVLTLLGLSVSMAEFNLICYGFSALFLLGTMNRYWRATIRDFSQRPLRALQAVILGYVLMYALDTVFSIFLYDLLYNTSNPNTTAVSDIARQSSAVMFVVSVILAPIVEETMFRGALFGTIRKKNRVLAYIVSIILFSIYHLWDEFVFGGGFSVQSLIYLLQYVPSGLALAWCYERSGSLVGPVVLHAVMNLIATVQIVWK